MDTGDRVSGDGLGGVDSVNWWILRLENDPGAYVFAGFDDAKAFLAELKEGAGKYTLDQFVSLGDIAKQNKEE